MNLESTTVVIEPRSLGACLDLALLFYRQHARALLATALAFAIPFSALAYVWATHSDLGLLWSAVVFFFASVPLEALVVSAAGHAVFGSSFAPWHAFGATGRPAAVLFSLFMTRVGVGLAGLPCLGVSTLPLAVYHGFQPEIRLLEQAEGRRVRDRCAELMRSYLERLAGAVFLLAFWMMTVLTLLLALDQALDVSFSWPLLLGRLDDGGLEELLRLILADPAVVAAITALIWIVYPMVRLAWFFYYLDVRIRSEAWDLELAFRIEARRLDAIA